MHLVIWRCGGRWERFFLVLGVFTYAFFLPGVSLAIIWALWDFRSQLYGTFLSFGLAATTYGAFHETFSNAMINTKVWRRYLDEGRFRPHDEYFREWIRFLENEGDQGLFPGAVRWSLAFWALYYGLMVFAIAFALAVMPTLNLATPLLSAVLDAVLILPAWVAWQRHKRAVSQEMDRKGYRLREYAKAAGWMPASR
jgi:hypothetical protein